MELTSSLETDNKQAREKTDTCKQISKQTTHQKTSEE